MQHITVYKEPGRYAGWPANYGIWSWGDEIVFNFTVGYHNPAGIFHARDRTRPFTTMQARSLDGGLTWKVEEMPGNSPGDRALSADEHMEPHLWAAVIDVKNPPVQGPGTTDFTNPNFALMGARTGLKAGAKSWYYVSTDRCRSWEGPYSLPMFEQLGIAARTDYVVSGPEECLLFLTSTKDNGDEGKVFCARTTDGGQTFQFVSWIGMEPTGYHIMPASVRITDNHLLTAIRCGNDPSQSESGCYIDLYESLDNGASWSYLNRPVLDTGKGGNPPTLTKLQDGRLCMSYGYRYAPYGIRAKLSADHGVTWGEEIILRADGGSHDLGYPRTTQRTDGTLVTTYYYNDEENGECYIGATLWKA